MTLGILGQVLARRTPQDATKHMSTETRVQGPKEGGCGGILFEWPGSAGKLGRKGMEKSLINKVM